MKEQKGSGDPELLVGLMANPGPRATQARASYLRGDAMQPGQDTIQLFARTPCHSHR